MKKKTTKNGSLDPLQLLNVWRAYQLKRWKKQRRQRLTPGRPTISGQLPHLKAQRTAKTKWRLTALLSTFTLGACVAIYFMLPISDVQQMTVNGTKSVPDQQVINASGVRIGNNVLTQIWQEKAIEKRIHQKLPKVKSVNVKVDQFNQLTLAIKEYPTVGYLVRHKQYYPILENGTILKTKMTQSLGNSPVYSQFKNDAFLKQGLKLYQAFPNSIQSAVSEIRLTVKNNNPYQVHLYMNDGNEVVGDLRTLAKKIKYYPTLAKQMDGKGRIDLEVGAYAKLFDNSEADSTKN
ncbi:cell division protein FtsQ/DivIB [Latilactobacillus curvatus]|uniref:cell division protein FtsQ/DivIB n=1 Tax=Latilactobacillus curvatus TaxID=28038 RepID=UPI0020C7C17A|nr:cell division protein FtsQ/DivIB [Latilactobacillus curvatus]MCP8848055.1 cell division protein FtsQ/DivIB [Latilactobacillus curvatus]MCP8865406.1 cell division protein FtsQ/DivIB [Latilactobacillus curvatus]MCP8874282.1 cell division protein FtsQ/DivIB [Latilactobacillus curvatus]MCP8876076.1 cell division protein FtsQ/DivIB [Latilactobacillus curvatus]MCP8879670.1 cell division protein FtsQ/DivIB [Latilactobacillus curvatus]